MSLMGGEVEPNATEEGCQFIPGCYEGEGGAGKVAEASPNYTLEESTLPDPAPGAEGIWLGFRSTDCYEPYSSNWSHHPDLDNDGLDDTCEHVLAKAFRPMLSVSASEPCLGGEPYWVAKYINNSPFGTGDMVKLGYMPAYYEDCGPSDAHDGDSEFIQLTVVNNTITGHWILVNSWLSAHTCADQGLDCTSWQGLGSSTTWGDDFEYPAGRARSFPRVYVSKQKHANYRSRSDCNSGGFVGTDTCVDGVDRGRFRVWEDHNIGSNVHPIRDCVYSDQPETAGYFQEECFWTERPFRGFQVGAAGVTPYSKMLRSIVFGATRVDATYWWWGTFSH